MRFASESSMHGVCTIFLVMIPASRANLSTCDSFNFSEIIKRLNRQPCFVSAKSMMIFAEVHGAAKCKTRS